MRAYVTATDGLRVRTEPNLNGKIYKKLKYRETVDVDRIVPDQWSKLLNTSSDLWVHGNYLSTTDPGLPFVSPIKASRVNLHMGAGGWSPTDPPNQLNIVASNKTHAMLVPTYHPEQAGEIIRLFRSAGVEQFVLRAVASTFPSRGGAWAAMAIPRLLPFVNALHTKTVMIQLHNEPNLYAEGLDSWGDGKGYNKWFADARNAIVQAIPGAKIGFSPLSPGGDVPNVRIDEITFLKACAGAIGLSDWFAVHCYYGNADANDLKIPIDRWKKYAQGKPIICTEAGPSLDRSVTIPGAQAMFKAFAKVNIPAFGWILDHTKNPHFAGQSWSAQGIVLPSFG